MPLEIRDATIDDIPAMSAIRLSVRENVLSSAARITHEDYVRSITTDGRGFVALEDSRVIGFSVGLLAARDLWALFVAPDREGRGAGTRLFVAMFDWFAREGASEVTFTTEPDTRADAWYAWLGCIRGELVAHGDVRYTWRKDRWAEDRMRILS
jgi:GNAT superfamily N-acetyltransferase